MSSICPSCGAASSGAAFCTSCGTAIATPVAAYSAEASETVVEPTDQSFSPGDVTETDYTTPMTSQKRKFLLVGAASALVLGIGVGSFVAGKSSVDLKKEQKTSYDSGFSAGDSAGYDRGFSEGDSAGYDRGYSAGDSAGYSRGDSAGYDRGDSDGYDRGYNEGKTAGCQNVFDNANYSDYLIGYYPYNSYYRYGRTYVSKTDC